MKGLVRRGRRDSRTAKTVKALPISLDPISFERQDLLIDLSFSLMSSKSKFEYCLDIVVIAQ